MNGRIWMCAAMHKRARAQAFFLRHERSLQVQWVQGHNPDLIVLDENGQEKDPKQGWGAVLVCIRRATWRGKDRPHSLQYHGSISQHGTRTAQSATLLPKATTSFPRCSVSGASV